MISHDLKEARKRLSQKLVKYRELPEAVVLGLARGGVPVAYEVAKALKLPLNVIVPRKIGAPYNPELAIGAIVETGTGFFNKPLIQSLEVPDAYILQEVAEQKALAKERVKKYRKNAPLKEISGNTIILVDDGIATGATMFAAVNAVRELGAEKVVAAVPVGATDSLYQLERFADDVVCFHPSDQLMAIGYFYENFDQTTDEEVIALLEDDYLSNG